MNSPFLIIIIIITSILFKYTATISPKASPFHLFLIQVRANCVAAGSILTTSKRSSFLSTYNIPSKGILTSSHCSTLLDCDCQAAFHNITDLGIRESLEQNLEAHIGDWGAVRLHLCGTGPSLRGLVAGSSGWSKWQGPNEKWCSGVLVHWGPASCQVLVYKTLAAHAECLLEPR